MPNFIVKLEEEASVNFGLGLKARLRPTSTTEKPASSRFKPKHSTTEQKQAGRLNLFQCEYKLFRLNYDCQLSYSHAIFLELYCFIGSSILAVMDVDLCLMKTKEQYDFVS